METNNSNISEKDRNSILNHIINCAKCALQNEDVFQKAMLGLAGELRTVFDSEYCSIGIVTDGYAEDCMISYKLFEDEELSKQQEIFLKSVKRVSIDEDKSAVCQALKSDEDIFFLQDEINQCNNYGYYQSILISGLVKNSCVIPIRDNVKNNYGFIQFININDSIDYEHYISPYKDALLGLVQIIINNKRNQQKLDNRLKDADFYSLMQDKRDNVDELLDSIMEYFSTEFNAAIVSFRIPLLNGYNKEPLFYLRRCYINALLPNHEVLKNHYYNKRFSKNKDHMSYFDELKCIHQGDIIDGLSASSDYEINQLELHEKTFIIPIVSDIDNQIINPTKQNSPSHKLNDNPEYIDDFKKLYGTFQLRIYKKCLNSPSDDYFFDFDEVKNRLSFLSKQITLLLDTTVDKHENESLEVFQEELNNSSFIKIKDFDERCVGIIKESVHAKVCSIYRYDDRTKLLTLSATTASIIKFRANGRDLFFEPERIKDSSFIHINTQNNLLARSYQKKQCEYILNILDNKLHKSAFIEFIKNPSNHETAMAIPMIKKDGTCAGVVLLLGKEDSKHSISTAYWEHDTNHIEFIVNMLTRISESDTERLTFLAQLSHELLAPVTELVFDNDLIVNITARNLDYFTKRQLVAKIQENIDRNLLFKYIINDTEFIYSSTGRNTEYNIVKQEKPQAILLDAIRLLEKQAHVAKGLSIKTYLKEMPPLYFDKERMMQVFLNLLKNAIRYADKHTEISISYNRIEDGFHEIRFTDVGIGIEETEKESIFELFHRGFEAKKRFIRGTGIGLFIVRDIMRAHGGDCYVRRLDNPTEFAITLPDK